MDLSKALITLGKKGLQVAEIARRPEGYFLTQTEGDNFLLIQLNIYYSKIFK